MPLKKLMQLLSYRMGSVKEIDWAYISSVMRKPSWLFDTRSICDIKGAKLSGLNVWSVGNGK